ncbi:MAG: DNA mismatch repair endonuclease MutL [Thermoplasmata archaeon]|nr:DNA mismatch repair endonuclease MutL [Thermoplasmata archaeon]
MQRIRVLSEELIGKIAAGEVVENPASVVKELVENAIDAGATEIGVEIEDGGKKKIKVMDNGCGMSAEDARIAWQRHTTSKIASPDDLFAIRTLGFRGEALASIAAVSRLTILTRDENSDAGIELQIENLQIKSERIVGMNRGTTVIVSDLFYNTPARLKHLKSERVELLRIMDVVVRYAIAYPEIALRFSTEKGTVLNKKPESDERAGLVPVLGLENAKALIPVRWVKGSVEIRGFISKPDVQKPSSDHIYLYVNKRWFYSKTIVNAVRDAYGEHLMKGKYPVALIFIQIPYNEVDVNVHPAKTEVRFADERAVIETVIACVRAAIKKEMEYHQIMREVHEIGEGKGKLPVVETFTEKTSVTREAIAEYSAQHRSEPAIEEPQKKIRVLGQVLNAYIVAEVDGELLLVDQHAACERIAYEKLRNFEKVMKQNLLTPIVVELSPKEARTLVEFRELLTSLGFEIEEFGTRTFTVRSVPAVGSAIATKESFREILADLSEGKFRDAEDRIEAVLKTIACKSSVKAGDPLSFEKMYDILKQLYRCALPDNCPHGRPTVLRYTRKDLDRMFLR